MSLSPIEKLDKVLSYMNHDLEASEKQSDINEKSGLKTDDKEIDLILEKLCKDGYVKDTKVSNFKIYKITFDGKVFVGNGMYGEKANADRNNDYFQTLTLWLMAVGTALAGIYGLIEICKWLYRAFCAC